MRALTFAGQRAKLHPQVVRVLDDPALFNRTMRVFRKSPPGLVPYVQTAEQARIAAWLRTVKRGLLLKARQIGGTTAVRGHAFHRVYALGLPERWATISYKQASTVEIGRTDRTFLESVDAETTRWLHGAVRSTTSEMEFPRTGGRMIAYTAAATGGTGTRSFALTHGHISELAFYPDAAELLATVEGSVGEGPLIAESTPNAPGDFFHQMCQAAAEGTNGWELFTSWWWQNEEYTTEPPDDFEPTSDEVALAAAYNLTLGQLAWRRDKRARLGPDKFAREFPGCMADAFQVPGGGTYEPELFASLGSTWVASLPAPSRRYVIGADPAGGTGSGDDAAYTTLDAETGEVADHDASDQWSPRVFAHLLAERGRRYNNALILVEQNNHGHAVLLELENLGYRNLYLTEQGKPFSSNNPSRLMAEDKARELLRSGVLTSLPPALTIQLLSLRAKPNLASHAPPGQKDDRALSFILAAVALDRLAPPVQQAAAHARGAYDSLVAQARAARYRRGNTPWAHR